jgi:RTX calcium-binding nonapeptide repeat (4 copies)
MISMNAFLHGIIITLAVLLIFNSYVTVFAIELNSTASITNNITKNLKSKINNLITNALNDTSSILNSSSLSNGSNLTSSQVVISKNKVMSTMSSNGSSDGNSIIKDKVTTVNGICSSVKVGGNGNDTLSSAGNCNDELTGGKGADKFTCGEGNDTIKDYDSEEGDVILDRQNCEKIL